MLTNNLFFFTGLESVPVMNSLASATKVVTTSLPPNPVLANVGNTLTLPEKIPISSLSVPIVKMKEDEVKPIEVDDEPISTKNGIEHEANNKTAENIEEKIDTEILDSEILDSPIENNEADVAVSTEDQNEEDVLIKNIEETKPVDDQLGPAIICTAVEGSKEPVDEVISVITGAPVAEPMDLGCVVSPKHTPKSDDVYMLDATVSPNPSSGCMQVESSGESTISAEITADDLLLLCDLFYLPFEHGNKALHLLNEFQWLKTSANVLVNNGYKRGSSITDAKPEVQEWIRRATSFHNLCETIHALVKKIAVCENREICFDLYSYVWEISGVTSLLSGFIYWLELGHFPANINTFTQGQYTWFSKGWKEAFMSGDNEPWVFRGGLTSDLQRLIPIDCGNDLFTYKLPDTPLSTVYTIRPYIHSDEKEVYAICHKTCRDGSDCSDLFPEGLLQGIPSDRLVGPFLTLAPEFCLVIEGPIGIVGYACAALDAKSFYRSQVMCWLPEMCLKYPLSLLDTPNLTQAAKDSINHFHNFIYDSPQNVLTTHPSIITCCILKEQLMIDQSVCKRVMTVLLAALRSNGSFGAHVCINDTDQFMYQFYTKLGFVQVYNDETTSKLYLGRSF